MSKIPLKKPCWYHIEIERCPNCFREWEIRERRYTRKPKSWKARHTIKEVYCGCSDYGIDAYGGGFSFNA